MSAEAKDILVVANETVGGTVLINAVKKRADQGPVSVFVVCPQNQPRHGYVIHDGTVREAAENRLKLTLAQLEEIGVKAEGEVMDPDPYAAIMDALGDRDFDEIVISTHPETRSGWLRQDLITRIQQESGKPVEHVVVDMDADRKESRRVLVVANQTIGGEPLIDKLEQLAGDGSVTFVVVCPANEGDEDQAADRLAHTLKRLEEEGLQAVGQVVHPDPFTAIQNALQFYPADEIVISTFDETRSGWLGGDLIGRVQGTTSVPVHHVMLKAGDREQV